MIDPEEERKIVETRLIGLEESRAAAGNSRELHVTGESAEARALIDSYGESAKLIEGVTMEYEGLLERTADYVFELMALGHSYRNAGELEHAVEAMEMMRRMCLADDNPFFHEDDHYHALVELGDIFFELELFEQALNVWEEASGYDNITFEHTPVCSRLGSEVIIRTDSTKFGRAYLEAGLLEESLAQFEKALNLLGGVRRAEVLVQIAALQRAIGHPR